MGADGCASERDGKCEVYCAMSLFTREFYARAWKEYVVIELADGEFYMQFQPMEIAG